MTNYQGKKIIISGGSRGIGAEAVRQFTQLGGDVAFLYNRSHDMAKELEAETGARAICCDVSYSDRVVDEIHAQIDKWNGRIDILICNAGISKWGLATDLGIKEWKEVVDVNLNGMFYAVYATLPYMISSHSGNIITVSSMWGQVGASCEVAYSASKAGIIGMTKALAKELGPSGIRVNCIAPGMIDTEMNSNVEESAQQAIIKETAIGRIGTVKDIVNAMVFLAGDESDYITGQVISVNGGLII